MPLDIFLIVLHDDKESIRIVVALGQLYKLIFLAGETAKIFAGLDVTPLSLGIETLEGGFDGCNCSQYKSTWPVSEEELYWIDGQKTLR